MREASSDQFVAEALSPRKFAALLQSSNKLEKSFTSTMDQERNKAGSNGIAPEKSEETITPRQPKKRFVGRRQIAENTASGGIDSPAIEGNSVQGFNSMLARV